MEKNMVILISQGGWDRVTLSPLLFYLAKEVLMRSISMLVDDDKLDLIKGTRTH